MAGDCKCGKEGAVRLEGGLYLPGAQTYACPLLPLLGGLLSVDWGARNEQSCILLDPAAAFGVVDHFFII